jgi:hypothetical protein
MPSLVVHRDSIFGAFYEAIKILKGSQSLLKSFAFLIRQTWFILIILLFQVYILFLKRNQLTASQNMKAVGKFIGHFLLTDFLASVSLTYKAKKSYRKLSNNPFHVLSYFDYRSGKHIFPLNYYLTLGVTFFFFFSDPIAWCNAWIWTEDQVMDYLGNLAALLLFARLFTCVRPVLTPALETLNALIAFMPTLSLSLFFPCQSSNHIFALIRNLYSEAALTLEPIMEKLLEPAWQYIYDLIPAAYQSMQFKGLGTGSSIAALFCYYSEDSFLLKALLASTLIIGFTFKLELLDLKQNCSAMVLQLWFAIGGNTPGSLASRLKAQSEQLYTGILAVWALPDYLYWRYFAVYLSLAIYYLIFQKINLRVFHVAYAFGLGLDQILPRPSFKQLCYILALWKIPFAPSTLFALIFVIPFLYSDQSDDTMIDCFLTDIYHLDGFVYQDMKMPNPLKRRALIFWLTYKLKEPLKYFFGKMNHVWDLIAGRVSKYTASMIYRSWHFILYYCLPGCATLLLKYSFYYMDILA